MAITNYSELKTAISDWAARSGLLSDVTPDFVTMTETLFNYGDEELDFEPLRCRQMEIATDLTVTSGSVALPDDYLEAIRVTAATSPVRELTYAEPGWFKEAYPSGQDSSTPKFYTIEAGAIKSVADFELLYYQAIPALSDSNTTNWLLTAHPNAYLFGGLLQYSIYQHDDAKAQRYQRLLRGAVRGLMRTDMMSKAGVFEKRASTMAW